MSDLREFGKFRLDAAKKLLWFEDQSINLPLKSIEILCLLTETNEVVTKEELLSKIWQDSFVEESNLTSHIYRLRKMFAQYGESEEIIQTVPKRGYRFTGEVIRLSNIPEIFIEKQIVTQILIEEIEEPSELPIRVLPSKTKQKKYWIPVLACLTLVITAFGYYFYAKTNDKIEGIKTVAVGKFSSLLDNEEEKVLALGVKEKLLLNLGNLKDLEIQNVNFDESEIDKIQNADAVLLGTIQKIEGQIRVNLRLLQTLDKRQIWSASFDEPRTNLFQLQDEISRKITDSLTINLTKLDKEKIYKHPTENKEAYENYLQGRYFFSQRGVLYVSSLKKAKSFFEKAIELDPNFAEACVGLADVINLQTDNENKLSPAFDDGYQKSQQLISKALELNPALAEAHAAQGWIQQRYHWNFSEAEKSYLKAIELNPALTNAHLWLSITYNVQGKKELGLESAKKAVEVEPTLPSALENLASTYTYSGQCDKTLETSSRAAAYLTDLMVRNTNQGLHLGTCGKCEEAIPLFEEVRKQTPQNLRMVQGLGYCYAVTKQTEKAREILKIFEESPNRGHSILGRILIYSNLGEKEKALEILSQYYQSKDYRLTLLNVHPGLKAIQSELKFKQIMQELNLGN